MILDFGRIEEKRGGFWQESVEDSGEVIPLSVHSLFDQQYGIGDGDGEFFGGFLDDIVLVGFSLLYRTGNRDSPDIGIMFFGMGSLGEQRFSEFIHHP